MNSFAQTQRDLQSHIINGDIGGDSGGDSDGDGDGNSDDGIAGAIHSAIDSSADVPASIRLKVYSDAYRLRLIEALDANYPVLAQLLGEESFARLAQEYLAVYPSRHYSIRWFGHQLAQFLREHEDYRIKPWLNELATWEWCIAAAFDASDSSILTVDDLAAVAPENWPQLQFSFQPSVQRLSLSTNAAAIVKASSTDEPLPSPIQLDEPAEWLIWRQDLVVRYRSLDTTEAIALDAVINGATFEELCEALSEHVAVDQVPLHAASLLKTWITEECLSALRVSDLPS